MNRYTPLFKISKIGLDIFEEGMLRNEFRWGFELEYIAEDENKHSQFKKFVDGLIGGKGYKQIIPGKILKIGLAIGEQWKGDCSVSSDLLDIVQNHRDTIKRINVQRKKLGLPGLKKTDWSRIELVLREAYHRGYLLSRDGLNTQFTIQGIETSVNDIITEYVYLGKGGTAYEYASPDMPLTPMMISNVGKMLTSLEKYKIYTNESCGMHLHISWPQMDEQDMFWVWLNLAYDKDMRDMITKYKDYKFYTDIPNPKHHLRSPTAYQPHTEAGRWSAAHRGFFYNAINYLGAEDWSELGKFFSGIKQTVMKLHPGGTLEWRGPRGFLDKQIKSEIYGFFRVIGKWVDFVSDKLSTDTLAYITKTREQKTITKYELFNNILRVFSLSGSKKFQYSHWCRKCKHNWISNNKFETKCPKCNADGSFITSTPTEKTGSDRRWNLNYMNSANGEEIINKFPWLKKAKFRNVEFAVGESSGKLVMRRGEWLSGDWVDGFFRNSNSIFKNGKFLNGKFSNGAIFENGIFQGGKFDDGVWIDGVWKGGKWVTGEDLNGTIHKEDDDPTKW